MTTDRLKMAEANLARLQAELQWATNKSEMRRRVAAAKALIRGMRDELAYANVTSELNDVAPPNAPALILANLRPWIVARAERHASAHGLAWPPRPGDFNRHCEGRPS